MEEKQRLIQLAGSASQLAKLLGVNRAAITMWKNGIPQQRIWQLKVLKPEWFENNK